MTWKFTAFTPFIEKTDDSERLLTITGMPGWGISPKLVIGVWTLINKQFSSPFTSSKSIPGNQSGISAKEFKQPLPKSVAGLIPAHGSIG